LCKLVGREVRKSYSPGQIISKSATFNQIGHSIVIKSMNYRDLRELREFIQLPKSFFQTLHRLDARNGQKMARRLARDQIFKAETSQPSRLVL